MARATRTPAQAVAFARNQHQSGSTRWGAMCLSLVRQAWGLPGGVPHANAAWAAARKKHSYNGNPDSIPYGAAVFSDRPGGSKYGHVFLAGGKTKKGRRIFWSNDIGGYGRVSPVTIDAFTSRWGHRILGWTEDLNGYDLNLNNKKSTAKPPKKVTVNGVPGMWLVDTATLNFRARPSTKARITGKRHKGAKVAVVQAVDHQGRRWFKTRKYGTWCAAGPKFSAQYVKRRKGMRK